MELDFFKLLNETSNHNNEDEKIPRIEMRKMTIVPLILLFIFLNFVMATFFNMRYATKIVENNYLFSIDLKSNLSVEEKEDIEKKVLEINGIKNIKYISKEDAFVELQNQLGVALSNSENSLPDSMIVYFDGKNNPELLQNELQNLDGINEIYIDEANIKYQNSQIKYFKFLEIILISLFFVPTLILILFIFYQGCAIEFINKYDLIYEEDKNCKYAKKLNLPTLIYSAIIGTLIFANCYVWGRDFIIHNLMFDNYLLTITQFIIYQVLIVIIICLVICIIPYWPAKKIIEE